MLKLLLDENISPALTSPLWEHHIDTAALRDRGLLNAADHIVWALGQAEGRAVVTINYGDFRRLARRTDGHAGLVIIPSGRGREGQLALIERVVELVVAEGSSLPSLAGHIVEVGDDGVISIEAADGGVEMSEHNSQTVTGPSD